MLLKPLSEGPHTQAVETEGAVVEEEADVACTCRHAVKGVGAAGRQRVDAAGEQENEQRPGEGVLPGRLDQHHCHQFPQEIPAGGGASVTLNQGTPASLFTIYISIFR